jgi:hypothetical protein
MWWSSSILARSILLKSILQLRRFEPWLFTFDLCSFFSVVRHIFELLINNDRISLWLSCIILSQCRSSWNIWTAVCSKLWWWMLAQSPSPLKAEWDRTALYLKFLDFEKIWKNLISVRYGNGRSTVTINKRIWNKLRELDQNKMGSEPTHLLSNHSVYLGDNCKWRIELFPEFEGFCIAIRSPCLD